MREPIGRRSSATASASCSARWPASSSPRCWSASSSSAPANERASTRAWRANWSQWQPKDTTIAGAARSPRRSRPSTATPNGKPLVTVTGGPLETRRAARRSASPTSFDEPRRDLQVDGLGPLKSIRAGHGGALPADPARGARARALHLPLPAGGPAGGDHAAATAATEAQISRGESPTRPGSRQRRDERAKDVAGRADDARRRSRSRRGRRTATDHRPRTAARRAVFDRPG